MGFPSMFEEIYEKLGVLMDIRIIIQDKAVGEIKSVDSKIAEPNKIAQNVPPEGFKERVSPLLVERGVPHYLIDYWTTWIYQYMRGKKSLNELFYEHTMLALPLLTEYLNKKDPTTIEYVHRLHKPVRRKRK